MDPVLGRRHLDEGELARISNRVDRLVDLLSEAGLDELDGIRCSRPFRAPKTCACDRGAIEQ